MAIGDLYLPKNADEVRDQYLEDFKLEAIKAGVANPPIEPGTDEFMRGTAIANIALIALSNIAASQPANSILDAVGDDLDKIRRGLGLPEATPQGAAGRIVPTISGPTTIPVDTKFLYPNGTSYGRVTQTYVNPPNGTEINVQAIDTGEVTNLSAGNKVRFTSTAPINVAIEAIVSTTAPLTGGASTETDDRKRDRCLNRLQNTPAGGNWGQIREYVFNAFSGIQDCLVYPTLGGPSTEKTVVIKDFNPTLKDYSRVVPDATLQSIRGLIWSKMSGNDNHTVQAVTEQAAPFTILVTIPLATSDGGDGRGWADSTKWPPLTGGETKVTVTAASADGSQITVSAAASISIPIAGQTRISWWSTLDKRFYSGLVVGVSGGSGAWVLTMERPFVDSSGAKPAIGDYISPQAVNGDRYAEAWVNIFRALGPGENTSDATKLPRALRHPLQSVSRPSSITQTALTQLVSKFPEITNIQFGYAPTSSPSVPGSIMSPPNILSPSHFGIYRL